MKKQNHFKKKSSKKEVKDVKNIENIGFFFKRPKWSIMKQSSKSRQGLAALLPTKTAQPY